MSEFSILDWKRNEVLFTAGVIGAIVIISAGQLVIGNMKTRDAQRKADVELTARALVRYRDDYGVVPSATDSGKIVSCGREGTETCEWGKGEIVDIDNITYLKKTPQDPWRKKAENIFMYRMRREADSEFMSGWNIRGIRRGKRI